MMYYPILARLLQYFTLFKHASCGVALCFRLIPMAEDFAPVQSREAVPFYHLTIHVAAMEL